MQTRVIRVRKRGTHKVFEMDEITCGKQRIYAWAKAHYEHYELDHLYIEFFTVREFKKQFEIAEEGGN